MTMRKRNMVSEFGGNSIQWIAFYAWCPDTLKLLSISYFVECIEIRWKEKESQIESAKTLEKQAKSHEKKIYRRMCA